jgi:hypothetical protein
MMRWFALLLAPALLANCRIPICGCPEAVETARAVDAQSRDRVVVRGHQGEDTVEIQIKLPAKVSAAVCVC